ncbi:MAG: T9SS type A sorting domain-containing protein [Dysgonomonas sp.]|nr:T9SS type A sorting domain-containing protein [Dysgonomonas sp.]
MKKKYFFIWLTFCISYLSAYSQISEGGVPPSFNHISTLRSTSPVYSAQVDLDVDRLIWEDSIMKRNGNVPRIAVDVPVDINIRNTGKWSVLPDSIRIWQQTVTAQNARGMIISYEDFYIPKGGKLFIYNEKKTHILGAYTNETHPEGGGFATEPISGDTFTFEYVASEISEEEPRLVVKEVGYIYGTGHCYGLEVCTPDLNSSFSCHVNVNCPTGYPWQNQKRGVVLLLIKNYRAWSGCSGSLVNNTAVDGKPYVLTASHCFDMAVDVQFDKSIVCFNYEFNSCENQTVAPDYKSLVGIKKLVHNSRFGGSDTYLFQINKNVPEEWHPYYNGWDRSNNASESGVVIHHPDVDVKKLALYDKTITSTTYSESKGEGAKNAYWRVVYNGVGVTEGGSSGSPLFNKDGYIIGTLTAGASTCSTMYSPDVYGKIWYAWDQHSSDILKPYLDPLNTGVERLAAYDPSPISGIEDENGYDFKELVLYPSPAENELNVNTSSIIRSIKVYDLQGVQVFSNFGYNSSTAQIPLNGLGKGVYTITVQTENKKLTDKFLKK